MAPRTKPKTAVKTAETSGVAKRATRPAVKRRKSVTRKTGSAKPLKQGTATKKIAVASPVKKTVTAASPAKKAVAVKKSKPGRPTGSKNKITRKRTRSAAPVKLVQPVEKISSPVVIPSVKVVSNKNIKKDKEKKPVYGFNKKNTVAEQKVKIRKKIKKSEVKVSRLEKKIKKAKKNKEGRKIIKSLKEKLVKALKKLSNRKKKAKKLNKK
jgi:histone H1/5